MIKKSILVGLGCGLWFLILSFPLAFHFFTSVFADPKWPFDTYGTLYGIWWWKFAFQNGLSPDWNYLVAHPFGLDWSHLPVQPLITYPLLFFSLLGGEIFAYNLFVLINYVLTGAIAYALCFYCTGHDRGSVLGALIYTFSANHLLQTMSHLSFSAAQWVPLFILSWLYLWKTRTWKSVLICSLSICLLFWSNYYFLYFSLFFVLCFFVLALWHWKIIPWEKMGVRLLGVVLLSGLILSPQWVPLATKVFSKKPTAEIEASGYVRSEKDLVKYAARPSDYLLPSEYHPVLGKLTRWVQSNFIKKGRHWSDRTLYLGFFTLFVALALWFFRRRFTQPDRFLIRLFTLSSLFFIWFSFSPWLQVGGLSLPTPSALLYPIFPMFRYYSRAGFFVSLFLAILVAFSWKYFPIKFSSRGAKNWVCAAAAIFILFEHLVIPPSKNINVSSVPEVYSWLKEQPGNFAIVEYPFVRSIEERQQKYNFYQRIHGKKLVNGGDQGTLSDMLRKKAQQIDNSEMWSLLSYYGVQFALVHQNQEKFKNIRSLNYVNTFGTTNVYQINSSPMPLYTLLWNFGQVIQSFDGTSWRWIGQTAKIWCLNSTDKPFQASLSLTLFSPEENQLKIILNGEEIFQVKIKEEKKKIKISNLMLKPGENLIELVPAKLISNPEKPTHKVSFRIKEPIKLKKL